jgi:hypothetical protein
MARKKTDGPFEVKVSNPALVEVIREVAAEDPEVEELDREPDRVMRHGPPEYFSEDFALRACTACGTLTTGRVRRDDGDDAVCPGHWGDVG